MPALSKGRDRGGEAFSARYTPGSLTPSWIEQIELCILLRRLVAAFMQSLSAKLIS